MHAGDAAIVKSEKHIVSKARHRNCCEICTIQWVARGKLELHLTEKSLCPLRG
jgi:hypothetical protein